MGRCAHMKFPRIALGIISTCFLVPLLASAQTTTLSGATNGLWNTGLNAAGGLLSGGASDPHYVIVSAPSGNSVAHRVNGALPAGWLANTSTAQWVSFSSNVPNEAS